MSDKRSHLTPAQVFGRRVREARERRGWKQQQLAEKLHIDRTTLNKIEQGTRGDVRLSQLFAFAAVLGIAPVHLLTPRQDNGSVALVPGRKPMRPRTARDWIRGDAVPAGIDPVDWLLDLPQDEQRALLENLVAQRVGATTPLTRALMQEEIVQRAEAMLEQLERKE